MNRRIYKAIEPIKSGRDEFNELRIDTSHQKGGTNPFSGKSEETGVYVYVNPVQRKGMCVHQALTARTVKETGFKVLAFPTGRRSEKRITQVADAVGQVADKIADLYNKEQFFEIGELIEGLVTK